jgi:folylpolyglutamate synthase/dihydropteroate synthase
MQDKNIHAILEALVPYVSAIVTTRADTRRAAEPDVLADIVRHVAPDLPVRAVDSPRDALTAAWKLDREIVVAGSIFLLGDVLRALERSVERPATGGGPSRP